MIFVSGFPITKILFTKIKIKSRLPCDNNYSECVQHTRPAIYLQTYEPFYLFEGAFEGAYNGLIQGFQA